MAKGRAQVSWASPAAVAPPPQRSGGQGRRPYLDNLKVTLVCCVIAGHAFITYSDLGSWAYREPSTNEVFLIVAALGVALGSLFAMGLFFLSAGLLTPRALARKGSAGFLRDRILRLGLPFAAYLVIYPLLSWWAGRDGASLSDLLTEQTHRLDPGPLWFVLVLLLYSAGYVTWRAVRPAPPEPAPLRLSFLVWLAVAIAGSTLLVRLWFPIDSYQVFALHLWQWPQCLGLFTLGVASAERGGLDPVSRSTRRRAGLAALAAVAVVVSAFAVGSDSLDPFGGGWAWQAWLTAVGEAVVAVCLSLWLLGHFQRKHDHTGRLRAALGRSAFGAYVLQAPVLVAVALAMSTVALAPEAKFLLVAPAAVAGSFGLAWLLTRTPGVNKVL